MKKLPLSLIYSRIGFGVVIILLTISKPVYFKYWIISLIIAGLLSDIFDGIIARRLGISTQKLRRLDSSVDQFFWLSVLASAVIISFPFFKSNVLLISIVIILEGVCYGISFIKFRKEVATHAIASKIWTLVLFATLIQIIATGNSAWLFIICVYLGIATRLEIICMILLIKSWTNDIPTVYHAILIRKGKPIKRHKLFNG